MLPAYLQLRGHTRINRHEMIARVKEAIQRGGGYIVDFHRFSNAALCINYEVAAGNLGKFAAALGEVGVLEPESEELLARLVRDAQGLRESERTREVMGTLNLTFIHDEPDLKIDVPAIPG